MRLHSVSVPVYDSAPAEAELNQFLATHRVIAMDRQLIPEGPRSTWAVCVSYLDRVNRGGSWNSNARKVRAANRNGNSPGNRNNNLGFRLAREQKRSRSNAPDPTCTASGCPSSRRKPSGTWCGSRGSRSAHETSPSTQVFPSAMESRWPSNPD